ncbi:MAG: restriction endonuclease subunit S [Acidobacteriota bacterium]
MKAGWKKEKLSQVCEKITDGTHQTPTYFDNGFLFLSSRNVTSGEIDWENVKYIDAKQHEEMQRRVSPRLNDILLAKNGTTGVAAIVDKDVTFNIYVSLALLRPLDAVLPKFLLYFINSPIAKKQFNKRLKGVGVPNLHLEEIREVELSYPESKAEQQRIVGILDEAFDGIATAKANAKQNLQNARALFESHLQSVFTQPGEGWVETNLGNVCTFVGGSQPPKSVFAKNKSADNIRLIQIRDYKSDKHIVFIPRALARRFCNADDVMIGRYGPPLFQILRGLEGAYNVALMKAVPDESILSRDFLFYFLKHSSILEYVIYHSNRAAGQIGVTKETLEPYPIALPSLPDQQTVVGIITELETETQRLESIYRQKLAALDELKKSLLHQAFTGQL